MYLGLDLGTTNVKAVAFDGAGLILSRGSVGVSLRHTPDGGIEQDIEEIWQATLQAIRAAGREANLSRVCAVGVSSQGGAIQVRTADGQCVGPVISWMDPRGAPFDAAFQQRQGQDWLAARTGHGRSSLALGQILRLRQESPALLAPGNVAGFVGDTIVQRLSGRAAHDGSSLSISGLYNPGLQRPDPDLLMELGLLPDQLPDLLPARQPAGALRRELAGELGLPAGIPIGPAVHDQYAAALGCGAVEPGDLMFGAGTAWVLLAIAARLLPPVLPSAWVCDHVVPGRWGQLLSLVVGGSAIKWASDLVGATDTEVDSLLAATPAGSGGLRLWPFLDATGGFRRPPSGSIHGLKLSHGRGNLLRASVEGLCLELARQIGWLEAAGCPIKRLIMCGGAARSNCTPQIVADVTGRPVSCPQETDISALGAGILARALAEPDTPIADLCRCMLGTMREIRPGSDTDIYAGLLREYVAAIDREAPR